MQSVLAACGGFLFAVLWFDLMFDVQVLAYPSGAVLPESVLTSIATYYRRVTTDASPMNRLIAAVMLVVLGGCLWQLARGTAPRGLGVASLVAALAPILLAGGRIVPNAARLATRADTIEVQSRLAHSICHEHLFCLGAIAVFIALQLYRAAPPA